MATSSVVVGAVRFYPNLDEVVNLKIRTATISCPGREKHEIVEAWLISRTVPWGPCRNSASYGNLRRNLF